MRVRLSVLLLAAAGLALAAGSPDPRPPEELIRLGNASYLRGDLDAAERYYAAAAERTTDPGLVAFNRAAVAVQRGEVREAELNYLRVLDDQAAPPDRRAKALYNRGVCLLARGGSSGVYRSAIACFELSLDLFQPDDPLAADARHNLELAKLLWNRARMTERIPPRPNDLPPDVPELPPPQPEEWPGHDPGSEPFGPGGRPGSRPEFAHGQQPGGQPRETAQKAPGAGNLPVVPDSDRPQPLTPEDTRAILQRVAERLEQDRRTTARLLTGPERPDVKDW
jgi:tetratricopeptide (TPR) repeat protein